MNLLSDRYVELNTIMSKDVLLRKKSMLRSSAKKEPSQQQPKQSQKQPEQQQQPDIDITPPEFKIADDTWSKLQNNDGQKYEEMTKFLNNSNKVNWSDNYLVLPNICFSDLNETRFEPLMNENLSFLRLINRKPTIDDYMALYSARSNKSLYIYGPAGSGKSFILYAMAARLMCESSNVVIYINNASGTTIEDILTMLKTRCEHDRIKIDINMDEFDKLRVKKVAFATDVVQEATKLYAAQKKKLIFVIDQINFLNATGFEFLNDLITAVKCILSASANNLEENNSLKTLNVALLHKLLPPIPFSKAEFKLFANIFQPYQELKRSATPTNPELDFDEGEIDEILSVTGALPIELKRFMESLRAKGSMVDWIQEYLTSFDTDYSYRTLSKWFESQSPSAQNLYIDNIGRLITHEKMDKWNDVYDRRIIFEEKKKDTRNNTNFYLRAVNPRALNLLVNFSNYLIEDDQKSRFISAMRSKLPQRAKGDHVESFIIESLSAKLNKRSFKFKVRVQKGEGEEQVVQLVMENYEIELFGGKKAPPRREIKGNTLFVPEDPTYPGYDVFYYDKKNESFYFIQITTNEKPVSSHVVKNDNNFAESQSQSKLSICDWIVFLDKTTRLYDIWIVRKTAFNNDIGNEGDRKSVV